MAHGAVTTPLLIVDDDQKFCRLVAEYLQPLGYRVDMAHDGVEGLARARSGVYAAAIRAGRVAKRRYLTGLYDVRVGRRMERHPRHRRDDGLSSRFSFSSIGARKYS